MLKPTDSHVDTVLHLIDVIFYVIRVILHSVSCSVATREELKF